MNGPRHPSTEGNALRPQRVDAQVDLTVAGESVADAAAGFFIQSTEPTNPPNGARWTDTSGTPPRTKIYDESTAAWIPINAGDRTFVSDTEPTDMVKGDIWFDTSPAEGENMFWFDGADLSLIRFLPRTVTFGFESGNTSAWGATNNLSATTTNVYAGTYSGQAGTTSTDVPVASTVPREFDGGLEPAVFSWFHYYNDSNSSGCGIRLFDSQGSFVVGGANNGGQFQYEDLTGTAEATSTFNGSRWYFVEFVFDWSTGTADLTIVDQSNSSTTTVTDLDLAGSDVETIQIDSYNAGTWQDGGDTDDYFDDITLQL